MRKMQLFRRLRANIKSVHTIESALFIAGSEGCSGGSGLESDLGSPAEATYLQELIRQPRIPQVYHYEMRL